MYARGFEPFITVGSIGVWDFDFDFSQIAQLSDCHLSDYCWVGGVGNFGVVRI